MPFEISELELPSSLGTSSSDPVEHRRQRDFADAIDVGNVVEAVSYGTRDTAWVPAEALPGWNDPFAPKRIFCVRVDGRMVARAVYETRDSTETRDAMTEGSAWLDVTVLPEFRGRGMGAALTELVEGLAIADGKAKALVYAASPEAPGPRVTSPTGFGSIPENSQGRRFLHARGYRLEQVERVSRLSLAAASLPAAKEMSVLLREVSEASGPNFRIHHWIGATPERWLDDMAVLATRMSTDAPTAGLEEEEDVWTAERVAADDERQVASPRIRLTAAVEHVPTDALVGFTELSVPESIELATQQWSTLVLREHRGHRLGMLLKVANLVHLERERPGHPAVITFNAEENRHMLEVNEHLGFASIGFQGAWRKDL